MKRLVVLAMIVACVSSEHRDAREKFNEGLDALAAGKLDDAEKALLAARSSAGVDPELRFRAAYDLGVAYAAHVDEVKKGKDADLQKALEYEQQAVSWFQDAANQRKDDADTIANLAIVRARAQALTDELARGEGKLEARLDAVIKQQRGVLDEARGAWVAIKQTGGSDPLAQQGTLTKLADQERGIVAEAGVIGDLAADEIDEIGKKPADKREQKEAARVIQLKNLDLYMIESRTKIADARRKLQDLAAEAAVGNAEAALVSLKRAREQLLDPITVLREVAQDQVQLVQETHAVSQVGQPNFGSGSGSAEKPLIPAWMEPPALGERELGLHDRVEEIRARLAGTLDSAQKPGADGAPPQLKPEEAKLIQQFAQALPFVTEAVAEMNGAHDSLIATHLDDAVTKQRAALTALARAIEYFADLKQTVDLAYGSQQQLVGLLGPEAAKVPAAERAQDASEALSANTTRMGRIKELIAEEQQKLDAQAKQLDQPPPAAGSGQQPPDPKQIEAMKQQVQQQKQMLNGAEVLRADAEKSIGELAGAIKANKEPLVPAKAGEKKLDDLRKLFFSVIEHLQQLLRDQNETKDQTSQANTEDDFTRGPKLPGLATKENEHSEMAKAITDALGKQADAAQKQQPDEAKKFAAAAEEVRQAIGDMGDAHGTLDKAATAKQSVSLDPSVKSEQKAIDHLEAALKILQPPQQNKDKQDQQKQDPQKQDQKKDQQQPQPQGGAGQRARDEDAKRQRAKQQQGDGDPVDKDW
ncbi:MAG TPA: hypothetical protein VGC41_19600 [Kofleriaceae bacterium]